MNIINNKNLKPLSFKNKIFSLFLFAIIFIELIFLGYLFNYVGLNPASIIVSQLIGDANTNRNQNGVSILIENNLLNKAAEMKVKDMADKSYFSHTTPENKKFTYFIDSVGYNFKYAGENLAVTQQDTEDVARAWMESPTHKANILRSKYIEIGMAMATGTYKGSDVIFIAQYFGTKANDIKNNSIKQSSTVLDAFVNNDIDVSGTFVLGEREDKESKINIINSFEERFSYSYTIRFLWILSVIFALISFVVFFLNIKYKTAIVNTFFLLTLITIFLIVDWYILFNNNVHPDFIDEIKFSEEAR